jgi:hypothetical protein
MKPMKFSILSTLALWIVLAGAVQSMVCKPASAQTDSQLLKAMPQVQGSRRIVLEALEQLLQSDPDIQLLGQGSWLRAVGKSGDLSRAYADPLLQGTSDHDLRLIVKGTDQQVTSKWLQTRAALRDAINSRFVGKSAAEIEELLMRSGFTAEQAKLLAKKGGQSLASSLLNSINVYAPNQLMRGVVDQKTAEAAFKRLGGVPNLGGRVVEGVWGQGTTTAVQQLEQSGRLFFRSGTFVRAGFTDLVHASEGYGRYTLGGAANLAAQWTEKALEATQSGDPSLFAKYLRRLKSELMIARNKGNLEKTAMSETFAMLDDIIAQAERDGAAVFGRPGLNTFLTSTRNDTELLRQLARNPGETDRQIINAILGNSPTRWKRLGSQLQQLRTQITELVTFERVMNGILLYMAAQNVSEAAGSQGLEAALRRAGVDMTYFVGLGPGILMSITNAIIEDAKDAGYALIISQQGWDDFLAGISAVKGYEGETGVEQSINRMAVSYSRVADVENFVRLQCRNIAALKVTGAPTETATAEARQGMEEALYRKMAPIIVAKWLQRRKELMMEYCDLALQLDYIMDNSVLQGNVSPSPLVTENATGSAEFALRGDSDWNEVRDLLTRMEAAIEPLGGTKKDVYFFSKTVVTWQQGDNKKEVDSVTNPAQALAPQNFTFASMGPQQVTATFRLEVQVQVAGGLDAAPDVFRAKPLLEREYVRTVPMTLDVSRLLTAKVEPLKPPRMAAPAELTVGDVFTLSIDISKEPEKRPKKYALALIPPGTRLTQEDLIGLSFSLGGPIDTKRVRYILKPIEEKVEGGAWQVSTQVNDIGLKSGESLDLALVYLDREGSVDFELDKAQKDMEKADAEMEKKLAAMTPEQREKFLAQMEAEIEKALANPPAAVKVEAEPLPESVVVLRPVLLRPAEIKLAGPEGWKRDDNNSHHMRGFRKVIDTPKTGERISLVAEINMNLYDEGMLDNYAQWEREKKGEPITIGNYKGRLVRRDWTVGGNPEAPVSEFAEQMRSQTTDGEAYLAQGTMILYVRYGVQATGYRRLDEKKNVLYDTFGQAQAEAEDAYKSITAMLGTTTFVPVKSPGDPAPPPADKIIPGVPTVRLVTAKTKLAIGEVAEIKAVVDNAKPDTGALRYVWSGNHEGKGDNVRFFASEPGTHYLGVIIYGANGLVGSTSIEFDVE